MCSESVAVKHVDISAGALIDQITFAFKDGTQKRYGQQGGDPQPSFELAEGEFIEKITGRKGDSLDAVQIHTNAGRKSQIYGNSEGGRPFELKAPVGKGIIGVERAPGLCGVIQRLICEAPSGNEADLPPAQQSPGLVITPVPAIQKHPVHPVDDTFGVSATGSAGVYPVQQRSQFQSSGGAGGAAGRGQKLEDATVVVNLDTKEVAVADIKAPRGTDGTSNTAHAQLATRHGWPFPCPHDYLIGGAIQKGMFIAKSGSLQGARNASRRTHTNRDAQADLRRAAQCLAPKRNRFGFHEEAEHMSGWQAQEQQMERQMYIDNARHLQEDLDSGEADTKTKGDWNRMSHDVPEEAVSVALKLAARGGGLAKFG